MSHQIDRQYRIRMKIKVYGFYRGQKDLYMDVSNTEMTLAAG